MLKLCVSQSVMGECIKSGWQAAAGCHLLAKEVSSGQTASCQSHTEITIEKAG